VSVNMVVLTGRLTADPELKYTQTGKALVRFALAVNRRYNRDETDFINVTAWDKKAELASQYLHKGSLIAVTGSIRVRSYDDSEGIRRKSTEVLVENLEFLDSKKSDSSGSSSGESNLSIAETENKSNVSDDDFPF